MAKQTYSEEKKAAVYGIRKKDSSAYFYVGCTKHDPLERFENHIYDAIGDRHYNRYFANKIKKYGPENVTFDVLETVRAGEHFDAEKEWIKRLLKAGHKLVNRMHNDVSYSDIVATRRGSLPDHPPKIRHSIPKLELLIQDLIDSEFQTIAVLGDYLAGVEYE